MLTYERHLTIGGAADGTIIHAQASDRHTSSLS